MVRRFHASFAFVAAIFWFLPSAGTPPPTARPRQRISPAATDIAASPPVSAATPGCCGGRCRVGKCGRSHLRRNTTPKRCRAIIAAARFAPSTEAGRQHFKTQLFLNFACDAAARFQLDEGNSDASVAAKQHQHIRQTSPHAALLLKQAAEHRKRLVLQRGPETCTPDQGSRQTGK
jgi:hypothetical protein